MALPQTFDITCSSCPRTFSMTLATLGQRKGCSFCGAALVIPEAAKQAMSEAKNITLAPKRLALQCPLCLRNMSVENPLPGKVYSCSYCTCPYTLDATHRPKPQAAKLPFPEPVREAVGWLSCPSCAIKRMQANTEAPAEARCTACGVVHDLYTFPLDTLITLPGAGVSPLVETACTALLSRWEQRDVGLAEAWWILEELDGVNRALSSGRSVLELISPLIAVDVAQYAIFDAPSAEILRDEAAVTLLMPQARGTESMSNANLGGTLAFNAVGIGLLMTTGTGFVGVSKKKDEGMKVDPALLLHFVYTPEGSTLRASMRNSQGQIAPLAAAQLKEIKKELDQNLPDAVRRLYVFKAIYGNWMSGAMLYGTPASALKTRLQSLGGSLARQADALATALAAAKK